MEENIELVTQALPQNGRRASRRNVKLDIKFHPYVLIRRLKLKDGAPAERFAFCNRFVNTL